MKSRPAPAKTSLRAQAAAVSESDGAVQAQRFKEVRLLGRGAMGAVYLVRDRETGEQFALKKLLRMDAKSVLRLKREFRALTDVSHRNLVKLYELGREDEVWFITMEYVVGQELSDALGVDYSATTSDEYVAQLRSRGARHRERVLWVFRQLAEGVHALHRARLLHRDLKPSNVLVCEDRVVLLDFGLALRLDERPATVTEEGHVAGTPAYMAPEQVRGNALAEASDWYAFGAMLYQGLTGLLPHDGSIYDILSKKLETDPTPPIELDPELPPSLNQLCLALLARDPDRRPHGPDVLARLSAVHAAAIETSGASYVQTSLMTEQQLPTQVASAPLYGRDEQMRALHEAKERANTNRTTLVHVRGISGAGKSALVEAFLNQLESDRTPLGIPETLVLRSRCYEQESMPFKALDGVMDAVSRHFLHFDDIEVGHMLPSDIPALAKLFPVLERVRAVQRLLVSRTTSGDAAYNRQRAEQALHEMLSRLSARTLVVIWIDDLQWGDLDSAGILQSWLRNTRDRPILVIFSYRVDEVETSECLRQLLGAQAGFGAAVEMVSVPPLASDDVVAICRERLAESDARAEKLIQRIVRESQGSPFLAAQLASLARAKLAQGSHDVDVGSVGGLVSQATALLAPEAKELLSVLAVAGRPIPGKLALRAAQLRKGGRDYFHELRRLQLVRTRDVAGERLLEVYHDRVREAVQHALDKQQSRRLHAALLAAASFSGRADPDWLHVLAIGAEEPASALRYGLVAAERATAALAFERAAELYKRCLDLCEPSSDRRRDLLRQLAAVLGWCGRGPQAADAYLEASKLSSAADALQLMRLATSHLLRSGRFEEGERMLKRVLSALDESIPTTKSGLTRAIVWERLRLAARGMSVSPRSADQIPAALLARLDTFEALRMDSMSVHPMRAHLFHLRTLRWALEAAEPLRLMRAFGACAYAEASGGGPSAARRADDYLARMNELAKLVGTVEARVEECVIRALASWMLGRPEEVLAPSREAEELLSKLPPSETGAHYIVRRAASSARVGALFELARYGEFAAELQDELRQVRAIDNRAAVLQLALNETLLDELLDRGSQAVERLVQQRSQLPLVEFSVYHALHMMAVCRAGGLSGEQRWALQLLEEDWPRFMRSPLRSGANIALHARHTRVHLLVSRHILTSSSVRDVPGELSGEIRALAAREPRARSSMSQESARLALAAGDRARAIELLHQSLSSRGSDHHADRVRYGLGMIMGGAQGAELCAQSAQALSARGLADATGCMRADYPELFCSEWR